MRPASSVTITNYNHAHFLPEALEAILSQSYPPLEVLITDDASTDASVDVIKEIARQFPIVRLIRNERNMGAVANTNRMLELASGDFVYCAAADDRVLPGLFVKSMDILSRHPEAGLCCSDPSWFDGVTGRVRENRLHLSDEPAYFSSHDVEVKMRQKLFLIAGHTSVVKKNALLEAGSLLPELRWHSDWFASLVIAFRYGICYIPEPLANLRVLEQSYSSSGSREWPRQRDVLTRMLDLLMTDAYRDVLPAFCRSGVLASFDAQILRVVGSSSKYRDYRTTLMIRRALWRAFRRTAGRLTPERIKEIARKQA